MKSKNYKLYNSKAYEKKAKCSIIVNGLGILHQFMLIMLKFSFLLIFLDFFYIKMFVLLFIFIAPISWYFLKNECWVCLIIKKIMNPKYKIGELPLLCPDLTYFEEKFYKTKKMKRQSWKWLYLIMFTYILLITKFDNRIRFALLITYIFFWYNAYNNKKFKKKWDNKDNYGRQLKL